jgi:CHAD domain-containing protein
MAASKWINDLMATTPLADAGRRALTVRLEVVRDYLPLALHQSDKDPEHVHQLRVGTRRARAALDIFAPCLPPKVRNLAKKRLRGIRRAAGEARDWDVFLDGVTQWAQQRTDAQRPGLDFLAGYTAARRAAAQTRLEEASKDYPFSFDRFLAETVAAVHKPHDDRLRTLADLAKPVISSLLEELGQAASGNLDDYGHLHAVRIVGKRLRYAMEIFAGCFATTFREQLYPAVTAMQQILGTANDSYIACGRLDALSARLKAQSPSEWKRLQPGSGGLLRYHRRRLPEARQQFLQWWEEWKQSGAAAASTGLPGSRAWDSQAADSDLPRVPTAQVA